MCDQGITAIENEREKNNQNFGTFTTVLILLSCHILKKNLLFLVTSPIL